MSRLSILICRVDEADPAAPLTPLHRIDVPEVDAQQLSPETGLDALETQALATGQEVTRRLLMSQWEAVDRQLVARYQRLFPPRDLQS